MTDNELADFWLRAQPLLRELGGVTLPGHRLLADIRRHISLMKSIDRTTVHLPIATVERLMSTGHKVNVGRGAVKAGKFQKAPPRVSVSDRIGRKAKADRLENAWKATKGQQPGSKERSEGHVACEYGRTIDDCPYDGRTTRAREWKAGFSDAAKAARKAARANREGKRK